MLNEFREKTKRALVPIVICTVGFVAGAAASRTVTVDNQEKAIITNMQLHKISPQQAQQLQEGMYDIKETKDLSTGNVTYTAEKHDKGLLGCFFEF